MFDSGEYILLLIIEHVLRIEERKVILRIDQNI